MPTRTNAPLSVCLAFGTLKNTARPSPLTDQVAHGDITKSEAGMPSHPNISDAAREKPSVTGSRQHHTNVAIQPATIATARIWISSVNGPRVRRSNADGIEVVASTKPFEPIGEPFHSGTSAHRLPVKCDFSCRKWRPGSTAT